MMMKNMGIECAFFQGNEVGLGMSHDKLLVRTGAFVLETARLRADMAGAKSCIQSMFAIWSDELHGFRFELIYGIIELTVIKTSLDCFYIEFSNSEPVSGFSVPKGKWGFCQGQATEPHLVGADLEGKPYILPRNHCLSKIQAETLLSQFFCYDVDSGSKIEYEVSQWQDTGKTKLEIFFSDPDLWEEAIGYKSDALYDKWMYEA